MNDGTYYKGRKTYNQLFRKTTYRYYFPSAGCDFRHCEANSVKNPGHPSRISVWEEMYGKRCEEKGVLPLPGRLFSKDWQERNGPAVAGAIVCAALVGSVIGCGKSAEGDIAQEE